MTHDPRWDAPMPEPTRKLGLPSGECADRLGRACTVIDVIDMLGVITHSYAEDDLLVMVVLLAEAIDGTDITQGENGANLATLRQHTEALQARGRMGGIMCYPPSDMDEVRATIETDEEA